MLRVAIVGCGKIADSHASQILRIPGNEIVAVCDKEELMAIQLAQRFPVKDTFKDLQDLLEQAQPDVVHITTPPQSHFVLAKQCLDSGCHVYVEKPFTIRTEDAELLIELANKKGKKITVGHDAQFSDVSLRMRNLVSEGYLGGMPLHMDSYWCYDLGDPTYAKALLGDKEHWARTLPGGLLHNIINHGVSKIAEFLKGDDAKVIAHGFVSSFLKKLGENSIIDELRAIIYDKNGVTAYFTFSTQMRPSLHQFHLYGHKNGLIIDEDKRLLIKLPGKSYKSYAEHFIPSMNMAKQYISNFIYNSQKFIRMNFHMAEGMKNLIQAFYKSIVDNTPVPIPYREILLTSRIMDSIFFQLAHNAAQPLDE